MTLPLSFFLSLSLFFFVGDTRKRLLFYDCIATADVLLGIVTYYRSLVWVIWGGCLVFELFCVYDDP